MLPFSPLCQAAYAADLEVVDGIAAVVNGDIITYSQVRGLVAPREKLLRSQYTGDELIKQIKEVRQAALKDLIDRQLIIQAFKKESYQIPDHFVDMRMHEIIQENFGGDRNTFIKTLEAQSFTLGEFKKMEMERMIVQAMRSKNVKREMIASPPPNDQWPRKSSASWPMARSSTAWPKFILKTAHAISAATGAGSTGKLWRHR